MSFLVCDGFGSCNYSSPCFTVSERVLFGMILVMLLLLLLLLMYDPLSDEACILTSQSSKSFPIISFDFVHRETSLDVLVLLDLQEVSFTPYS